jgi:hypothetical protein
VQAAAVRVIGCVGCTALPYSATGEAVGEAVGVADLRGRCVEILHDSGAVAELQGAAAEALIELCSVGPTDRAVS